MTESTPAIPQQCGNIGVDWSSLSKTQKKKFKANAKTHRTVPDINPFASHVEVDFNALPKMTFNDPLIEMIKNLLDSSFNGCVVHDEEIKSSIEQVNGARAHDWFNLGFAFKSIILRTQILNKWDNGQKTENEKILLEKQVKEFDIVAREMITEWTNNKNKIK